MQNKKIFFLCLVVFLQIIVSLTCFAATTIRHYPNEPTGFRGYHWGISVESAYARDSNNFNVSRKVRSTDIHETIYNYYDGNQAISNMSITGWMTFNFYDNKLYMVIIPLSENDGIVNGEKFEQLKAKMTIMYGAPSGLGNKVWYGTTFKYAEWAGPVTNISLSYIYDPYISDKKKGTRLSMRLLNKALVQKMRQDENRGW